VYYRQQEEIEKSFSSAGWELDGGFSNYLVVGYSGEGLSILARKEAWQTDDEPVFELVDHERNLTYGVHEIPTPEQASKLLQEHGLSEEEEWDYQWDYQS
jgi:hypothetical protein